MIFSSIYLLPTTKQMLWTQRSWERSALSLKYVDLVRETMGSMEFTSGNAKENTSDIKIFMKDIGVSGYMFRSLLIFSTQLYPQPGESYQRDVCSASCIV